MNNKETEILFKMRFLNMDQRSDVLQYIEKLRWNDGHKNYRRQAMVEIRKALNVQS